MKFNEYTSNLALTSGKTKHVHLWDGLPKTNKKNSHTYHESESANARPDLQVYACYDLHNSTQVFRLGLLSEPEMGFTQAE